MKKLQVVWSILLVLTAALLVAFFFVVTHLGEVTQTDGDLNLGIALVLITMLTAIPSFASLPVAAGLLLGLLLFVCRHKKGGALLSCILLGVFLPFLGFCIGLNLSAIAAYSVVYTSVSVALAAVYFITFVLTIVLLRKLKREGTE